MGGALFDEFHELTAKAYEILGYSIKTLCLEDPNRQLGQTQFTQPALYVVNALTFLEKQREDLKPPDYLAGHSLGEYNALFAAGAFDFEIGLRLVQKRGALMNKAPKGTMAAILNCSEEKIREILKSNHLETIDVANYNAPSQIVIAGLQEDIQRAGPLFQAANAVFIPLKVSAAFHSRQMQGPMKDFATFLDNFTFAAPKIPVISNVHARPYQPHQVATNLKEQIVSSVKWTESIRYLMGQGITDFEELGPGDVLTKLIRKIQTEVPPLVVEAPFVIGKGSIQGRGTIVEVNGAQPRESQSSPVLSPQSQSESNKATPASSAYTSPKPPSTERSTSASITPENLGSREFREDYNLRYAYLSGAMYKAIASKELVVRMGKAGYMGFYGTGGVRLSEVEDSIQFMQRELSQGEPFGMNLLCNLVQPEAEMEMVDLFLRYGIKYIEASAYIRITPALVKYRLKELSRNRRGEVVTHTKVMAKVSRPEVARSFLEPASEGIVKKLLEQGQITPEEADMSKEVPMADDLCVESDSGGHTDMAVTATVLPAIVRLRDEMRHHHRYATRVRVGSSGGIGTPEAAASAFVLGADFILTGSINQCTVEAGMSHIVKEMLQQLNVQDTAYAPAGDMFELGAKVQVMKKGVFFPARATKLYDLWRTYNSLEQIDPITNKQIQEKFFKKSFEEVYEETRNYYLQKVPSEIEKAERNPKHKMALIFRWYFIHTMRMAIQGKEDYRVDFQVHSGPAIGAFNQWVKGTDLKDWQNRHVDDIGDRLMEGTAEILNQRFQCFLGA